MHYFRVMHNERPIIAKQWSYCPISFSSECFTFQYILEPAHATYHIIFQFGAPILSPPPYNTDVRIIASICNFNFNFINSFIFILFYFFIFGLLGRNSWLGKKYNNSITLILIVHDVRWSIDSDSYFHRVTFWFFASFVYVIGGIKWG